MFVDFLKGVVMIESMLMPKVLFFLIYLWKVSSSGDVDNYPQALSEAFILREC